MVDPLATADDWSLNDRIELLQCVGSIAYGVSPLRDGWRSSSLKSFHAQVLFQRLFDIGTSILRLCDVEENIADSRTILDPASIAALTRNLMEAYDTFWYLVVERVSKEQSDLRHAVWALHYHIDAKKVRDVLASEYSTLWSIHESGYLTKQYQLQSNAAFQDLPKDVRKAIVKGRLPFVDWQIRNERRGKYLTSSYATAFYKYLSNQTHTHPFGLKVALPKKNEPTLGRTFLLEACLDLTARDLALATLDYITHMRRWDRRINPKDLSLLEATAKREWCVRIA